MARSSNAVEVDLRHTRVPSQVRGTIKRAVSTDRSGSETVRYNGQSLSLKREIGGEAAPRPFIWSNNPGRRPKSE